MNKEIIALQEKMKEHQIDAYIIPTGDDHQSEYVDDHFKARAYLSHFTGSAGTLLVTSTDAYLWTDGRYFIQAKEQLENTGVTLMKMNTKGTPTLEEFIEGQHFNKIGFDGKTMAYSQAKTFSMEIESSYDLVGEIWENRPPMSHELAFIYDLKYCGERTDSKLEKIRNEMKALNTPYHLITTLDDIAWIFNIRGNDVACNPVVLAFALITMDEAYLYIQKQALSYPVIKAMESQDIIIKDYEDIYEDVKQIKDTIMLDETKVNYTLVSSIAHYIHHTNPSQYLKSIKNDVEIENTKKAHLKDGIAMTKFMYYIKTHLEDLPLTEISASDFLEELRMQEGAMELSFTTICAYGPHGALMHYGATKQTDVPLKPEGFLLVDSGGQYLEGTTDITRTFVLGPITPTMKQHFTAVVKSHINLASASFLYGCTGVNLDILAREPIWELMLDYQCGTGHGVGHLLNVHEGPNSFRWQMLPIHGQPTVLEENMITTDEPGIYLEGKYGIRIENELLCQKGITNEYGTFMHFEPITICPIDLDGIDPNALDQKQINYLNEYHQMCYEMLAPHLTDDERTWLKEYTRKIERSE